MNALESLVIELEQDRSLEEPHRLRQRIEALDLLESYGVDREIDGISRASSAQIKPSLHEKASAIRARLESANLAVYQTIRCALQGGAGAETLLGWVRAMQSAPVSGECYDSLDELISGVLQFEEPPVADVRMPDEMVFYQPTPARHIFDLIERAGLSKNDVLIDLGSGLGHIPLLTSVCTSARAIGIELESAYVRSARRCAEELYLDKVSFIEQDVRVADLSRGTVFYLYTPFTGSILRSVLDRLQREAASREIRICTFGPCTRVIAEEPWLAATESPASDRVAVFRSLNG